MFWSAKLDREYFCTLFVVAILYSFIPVVSLRKLQWELPVINSDNLFPSFPVVTSVVCYVSGFVLMNMHLSPI